MSELVSRSQLLAERRKVPKVLAISSRGGHWIQLLRLRAAFEGLDIVFVTTDPDYRSMVGDDRFRVVQEATRKQKLRMLRMVLQIFWILIRERPTAIVTTGAAPGYFAVRLGRWLGAKTLWIDSIANAEELSLSGRLALKHAHVLLTQWSHLATPGSGISRSRHLIFVTVGNMDPFDRLIAAIDRWLAEHAIAEDVLAQIGVGTYQPSHCRHVPFLTPREYRTTFEQARFVVSHAGMGSIITALELQKPIVVMPKRASLNEQRNEHQLATVRHFRKSPLIKVADTEQDLAGVINQMLVATVSSEGKTGSTSDWPPNSELIDYVRAFVTQTV